MRLYKLTIVAGEETIRTHWVGSQGDAAKVRKGWVSDEGFKRTQIRTEEVDVPTNKEGLLAFLNGGDEE
jgi:hypothetical protein